MHAGAVIVAAGSGQRTGGNVSKQLRLVGGRPMLGWSLEAFRRHPGIERIVLVVPTGEIDTYHAQFSLADQIVEGGATRADSVLQGLRALQTLQVDHPMTHVLIHDAARPGIDQTVISQLLESLQYHDGAAPALPVVDALKRSSGDQLENVDRADLWRVQTPQGFRLDLIIEALSIAGSAFVDDLAAVENLGANLGLIEGSERFSKVTYPEDFARMETLLETKTVVRMGTGFDVHGFEPGGEVTLCGVAIPHSAKLEGHSDADVAWHALTDAIFGAAALGDIGDHFPPSDPKWAGAESEIFLREAVKCAAAKGLTLSNCDLTIICEAPKVKPHRDAMRARTAEVLGVSIDQVSVKATTTEGLGFTGRREGIAAQASVVLIGTRQ
ncbi:MAG: bifunctional 2-C-methyl-D-erythritol 4-phosphate cytidylyltransferase/2-C-methyl-D-erythritol 2,4-cyclodiphosphate synthase [Pseudomonadota bacterium]